MTELQEYFIELSRAAISDASPPPPPEGIDWRWLWDKANEQNLSGLIASTIEKLPESDRPTDFNIWYVSMMQTALIMGDRFDEFDRVVKILKSNGIALVCLKGAAIKTIIP